MGTVLAGKRSVGGAHVGRRSRSEVVVGYSKVFRWIQEERKRTCLGYPSWMLQGCCGSLLVCKLRLQTRMAQRAACSASLCNSACPQVVNASRVTNKYTDAFLLRPSGLSIACPSSPSVRCRLAAATTRYSEVQVGTKLEPQLTRLLVALRESDLWKRPGNCK